MTASSDFHTAGLARMTRVVREMTGVHERVALLIAEAILAELSGQEIPEGVLSEPRQQRDAAMRAAFTGHNHGELMRRFRVSRATVYRILGEAPAPAPASNDDDISS